MSKLLPTVSIVTEPPTAGVQAYQIDPPPALPAWLGSPVCLVAPVLVAVMVPELPVITWALANASLGGTPPVAVTVSVAAFVVAAPALLVNTAR